MDKVKKIIVIIFLLAIFAAVVFFVVREEEDQYAPLGPEVLLGSECGFDYLPCCQTEPKCSFGQKCCPDPNDPGRSYCADECTCGAEQEFCCAGNTCEEDLVCYFGNCRYCGREGDICCGEEGTCNDGLSCLDNECVPCGIAGNPCCEEDEPCQHLEEGRLECLNSLCELCGFGGLRACEQDEACLKGHLYNNNSCFVCGGSNQPCCNEDSGLPYDCNPNKGLICDTGFCRQP